MCVRVEYFNLVFRWEFACGTDLGEGGRKRRLSHEAAFLSWIDFETIPLQIITSNPYFHPLNNQQSL